jgi:hypothetical protein
MLKAIVLQFYLPGGACPESTNATAVPYVVQIEKIEKAGRLLVVCARPTGATELECTFQLSFRRARSRHLRLGGGCRRPVVTPRHTVLISRGGRDLVPSCWPLPVVLPIVLVAAYDAVPIRPLRIDGAC